MRVDKPLIEHVAKLARLKLTESEIEEFMPQVEEILAAFSELDKVETDGTIPSLQPVDIKNIAREDVTKESLTQEDALKNSDHTKDGYFKGPRAL
jgi:aspartyl-tRNA(Asn)/glutamyl-tRNA(Gln) amidotransferase subunit C